MDYTIIGSRCSYYSLWTSFLIKKFCCGLPNTIRFYHTSVITLATTLSLILLGCIVSKGRSRQFKEFSFTSSNVRGLLKLLFAILYFLSKKVEAFLYNLFSKYSLSCLLYCKLKILLSG